MTNYKVDMLVTVVEIPSLTTLIEAFTISLSVRVPAYTVGDTPSLVMHLEAAGRLETLYQLRKAVAEGKEVADLPYGKLIDKQFIVRGTLNSYTPI